MTQKTSKLARLLMEGAADEVQPPGRFSDWDDFARVKTRTLDLTGIRYFRVSLLLSAQFAAYENIVSAARFDYGAENKRIACRRIVGEVFGEFAAELDRILYGVAGNGSRRDVQVALSDLRERMMAVP